jgi:putative membrane protein
MYWDHMNGWGWTMMVVWSFVWIGFLGVAAWFAIHWIRGGQASTTPPAPTKTAREVLDERLARGDIDPEEYRQRRSALEQRSHVETPS